MLYREMSAIFLNLVIMMLKIGIALIENGEQFISKINIIINIWLDVRIEIIHLFMVRVKMNKLLQIIMIFIYIKLVLLMSVNNKRWKDL